MDFLDTPHFEYLTDQSKRKANTQIKKVASVHGSSVKTIAGELMELKGLLLKSSDDEKQRSMGWVAFCNLGVLDWGERTIYDYVAGHPWLEQTTLDDSYLGRLSVRVIGEMGRLLVKSETSEEAAKKLKDLEKRMEAGEVITQEKFYGYEKSGEVKVKPRSLREINEELEAKNENLKMELIRVTGEMTEALAEKRFYKMTLRMIETAHKLEKTEYEHEPLSVRKRWQKKEELKMGREVEV